LGASERRHSSGASTDVFPQFEANPVRLVTEDPVSTFSIDVDTVSCSYLRRNLELGLRSPPGSLRIEEMVNYFPYKAIPVPERQAFGSDIEVMTTPWNPETRLVKIAIQGRQAEVADRPPLDLVFLIDTSGSMEGVDRLDLIKQAIRMVLPELREEDEVAIVTYAGSAGVALEPTPAKDRQAILNVLDMLTAGGSTAGHDGLVTAYGLAARMREEGDVSRIMLVTDGDFNLGIQDPSELKSFIAAKRKEGTYLSVFGVGQGNMDDVTLQVLAQNGNGTAAYIDTLHEARKVLVDQFAGAFFPISDDVKVQVEWNPAAVSEYRLIGYETRALAREDFNNDKVDAGEIGSGHHVTALYEITPVGSPSQRIDPLRYGSEQKDASAPADELGWLKLRWKEPGQTQSRLVEYPIQASQAETGDDFRFAAAIAGFGQIMDGGKWLGSWSWDDMIALAEASRGEDPFGYRAEAVRLMRLAKTLEP